MTQVSSMLPAEESPGQAKEGNDILDASSTPKAFANFSPGFALKPWVLKSGLNSATLKELRWLLTVQRGNRLRSADIKDFPPHFLLSETSYRSPTATLKQLNPVATPSELRQNRVTFDPGFQSKPWAETCEHLRR